MNKDTDRCVELIETIFTNQFMYFSKGVIDISLSFTPDSRDRSFTFDTDIK